MRVHFFCCLNINNENSLVMKNQIQIPQEVLMNIDFINTVNGGMSASEINLDRNIADLTVRIKTPGIHPDDLNIEIVKNRLMVSHLIPIFGKRDEEDGQTVLHYLSTMEIPPEIDMERISAWYDDDSNHLLIQFPFNGEGSVQSRKIDIERLR
jgi:HSP20 family molecular chaperone IbpA